MLTQLRPLWIAILLQNGVSWTEGISYEKESTNPSTFSAYSSTQMSYDWQQDTILRVYAANVS